MAGQAMVLVGVLDHPLAPKITVEEAFDRVGDDLVVLLLWLVCGLPACAVSTPERAECRIATPVDGAENLIGSRVVSADAVDVGGADAATFAVDPAAAPDSSTGDPSSVVPAGQQEPRRPSSTVGTNPTVPGGSGRSEPAVVYALAAGPSSPGGDYTRTSLSPTYGWAAGSQGGAFTYRVPLQVPDGVGGPTPEVTFRYSSASVDGRTAATNGQSSWLGEGWDYTPGYIEQGYRACNEDGWSNKDLCWLSDDATGTAKVFTMVFAGRSTRPAARPPTCGATPAMCSRTPARPLAQ